MTIARITSTELIKLRTLPVVVATVVGTIATAIVLAGAIAASSTVPVGAVAAMLATIPFVQIGVILLGVLAVATEYQSSQIRTTLAATPRRRHVLAGKGLAFLGAAVVTSTVAVGSGWATAAIVSASREVVAPEASTVWPVVGAAAYLALIGSLAFALTVLLRALVPPLVAMLSLALIVSPLAGSLTEHARWLPDRAGGLLYLGDADAVLDAPTGALVLVAWIVVVGVAAGTAFSRRDA